MGLFRRSTGKKPRAQRKTAARAAKKERAEAKRRASAEKAAAEKAAEQAKRATRTQAKSEKAAVKQLTKSEKTTRRATKAQQADARAVAKAEEKAAEKVAESAKREPMTAKRAKRLIGVGQVVLPVLAPYALSAATAVRAQWDARRAARLGVAADQLGSFAGPGGALHARLSHVADALAKLDSGAGSGKAFAERATPRLTELSLAVRAAEQMPPARRRAAFKAIANELDTIESALLDHLGVGTG